MRFFRWSFASLLGSCSLLAAAEPQGPTVRKPAKVPNLVFLLTDDQCTYSVGCYGNPDVKTPTKGKLPERDFDKWGAGPGQTSYETKKNKSMAAYAEKYPHSSRSYGAFGADFIAEAAKAGKPFCLSISFKAPHKPATPDPLDDGVYAGKKFVKPKNYGRENGRHFSKQSRQGRQYERFVDWNYADKYDEVMAVYHQQVYAVDVAVGMVRHALEKSGVAGNTVAIFTSDNGFLCGSHGYGSKVLPYEEASRVPLIIYDPRHPNSGKKLRCKALTGNVDFAPTILELAGVKAPDGMDIQETGNQNAAERSTFSGGGDREVGP